jgi:hypothetical protein
MAHGTRSDAPPFSASNHHCIHARRDSIVRLFLLIIIVALGLDAYFYSGAYTQTAVHAVSVQVRSLASNIDSKSERPTPSQPAPHRG